MKYLSVSEDVMTLESIIHAGMDGTRAPVPDIQPLHRQIDGQHLRLIDLVNSENSTMRTVKLCSRHTWLVSTIAPEHATNAAQQTNNDNDDNDEFNKRRTNAIKKL